MTLSPFTIDLQQPTYPDSLFARGWGCVHTLRKHKLRNFNIPWILKILRAISEDPDQTAQLRSLIRVFADRICRKVLFFCWKGLIHRFADRLCLMFT